MIRMRWEHKALIGIIVITFSLIFYAYKPFLGEEATPPPQTPPPPEPQPVPVIPFNSSNNTTNISSNNTTNITIEKAKEIASKPGYSTGEPTSGSINIQGKDIEVWIVPLYKDQKLAERIYIGKADGKVVATEKFQ